MKTLLALLLLTGLAAANPCTEIPSVPPNMHVVEICDELTPGEHRRAGWRYYRCRWVKWVVVDIARETPEEELASDVLDELRDLALDGLSEAVELTPVVGNVKTALEHTLATADASDVYVTYALVDEQGEIVVTHVVHLSDMGEILPWVNERMPQAERQRVLDRHRQDLNRRMTRGWDPSSSRSL